jgi:hypothetical protein
VIIVAKNIVEGGYAPRFSLFPSCDEIKAPVRKLAGSSTTERRSIDMFVPAFGVRLCVLAHLSDTLKLLQVRAMGQCQNSSVRPPTIKNEFSTGLGPVR